MAKAKRLLGLILCFLYCTTEAALLRKVTVERNEKNEASVRCQFSGAFQYHHFSLQRPHRVIVDLPDVSHHALNLQIKKGGLIQQVRQGYPTAKTLRLVFDVPVGVNVIVKKEATQLLLQLTTKINQVSTPSTLTTKVPSLIQTTTKPVLTQGSGRGYRNVIIVLDPGHGGHDPGAIGPAHRAEKHVTLAIAKSLKRLIDKQPGMHAILTRDGDYYIGLRERLNIARQQNADVFISIHADAFIHAHSHGASVFALSQRGATSEAARWLAEKENYSELGGVNLKYLDDKNGMIRSVLLDLSQTATISAGLQMGTQVLQDLGQMTTLHHRHVEQARFVVLKSPDTPSILIETGFISNPVEAMNLSDPRYQIRLSEAIVSGLKRYFWAHPPHGTRLEMLSNTIPAHSWLKKTVRRLA